MWFSIGISRGECSRMYLHLVDGRDDASDLEDPFRLEDVEVGKTRVLRRQRGQFAFKAARSTCQWNGPCPSRPASPWPARCLRLVVLPGLVRMRDCKQLLDLTACPKQDQATPTMHQVQTHCLIVSKRVSTHSIH